MGKTTGFLEYGRRSVPYRDAIERLRDFKEIYTEPEEVRLQRQGPLPGRIQPESPAAQPFSYQSGVLENCAIFSSICRISSSNPCRRRTLEYSERLVASSE